jgi:hypothetical protein
MPRDNWVSDSKCNHCYECRRPFSLMVRRHHCRMCGQVFCSRCTNFWLPGVRFGSPERTIRLCKYCHQREISLPSRESSFALPDNRKGASGRGNAGLGRIPTEDPLLEDPVQGNRSLKASIKETPSNRTSDTGREGSPGREVRYLSSSTRWRSKSTSD